MTTDPIACRELACPRLASLTLQECEDARCCWSYVRRREESRLDQERKDRAARDRADAVTTKVKERQRAL